MPRRRTTEERHAQDLTTMLVALLFAAGVQAAEVGGVKLDDKVAVGGQDLVLNGAGIRTRAIFKVYVGEPLRAGEGEQRRSGARKGAAPHPAEPAARRRRRPAVDALVDGLKENNSRGRAGRREGAVGPDGRGDLKGFGQVKEKDVVTLDFVDGAHEDRPQRRGEGHDRRRRVQQGADQGVARRQSGAGRSQEGDARRLMPDLLAVLRLPAAHGRRATAASR